MPSSPTERERDELKPRSTRELDVLILGPVPPPFGGVAVHVERTARRLRASGVDVGVLNHYSSDTLPLILGTLNRNPIRYLLMPQRIHARVVHYHHSNWLTLIATAIGRRKARSHYIATFHSAGLSKSLGSRIPGVRMLTTWALGRFDTHIAVSPPVGSLVERGLRGARVIVLPAFVPPVDADSETALASFLAGGPTLVVACYRVQFLPDGREIYGLDIAVEAFAAAAKSIPDLKLAVFLAEPPSKRRARQYLSRLHDRLEAAGLAHRSRIVVGEPLTPALTGDVVFVRPTRSEGDALSVREALRAGVPVICSDVAARPSGAMIVPVDDVDALTDGILRAFESRSVSETSASGPIPGVQDTNDSEYVDNLIRLYEAQLDRRR